MFVRKKKNKSGVISVQIIDKVSGKSKLVKTIGSSSKAEEVSHLVGQREQWIKRKKGQLDLDFDNERKEAERFFNSIQKLNLSGTDLLLGSIPPAKYILF